jgi:putative endonuclease
LHPTSRSRAAVARRAHNPKVGGSIPPFATKIKSRKSGIFIMYKVYVLYSEKYNKIYVGCTGDLEARLLSHNELGTKGWTIKFRPWTIVYQEEFETKAEALKREKELKTASGRRFIWETVIAKMN